jgi:hypothetical protein
MAGARPNGSSSWLPPPVERVVALGCVCGHAILNSRLQQLSEYRSTRIGWLVGLERHIPYCSINAANSGVRAACTGVSWKPYKQAVSVMVVRQHRVCAWAVSWLTTYVANVDVGLPRDEL